jgi:hypothetical protein
LYFPGDLLLGRAGADKGGSGTDHRCFDFCFADLGVFGAVLGFESFFLGLEIGVLGEEEVAAVPSELIEFCLDFFVGDFGSLPLSPPFDAFNFGLEDLGVSGMLKNVGVVITILFNLMSTHKTIKTVCVRQKLTNCFFLLGSPCAAVWGSFVSLLEGKKRGWI